jgi:hypothetical protein
MKQLRLWHQTTNASIYEVARPYATFANEGYSVTPKCITVMILKKKLALRTFLSFLRVMRQISIKNNIKLTKKTEVLYI